MWSQCSFLLSALCPQGGLGLYNLDHIPSRCLACTGTAIFLREAPKGPLVQTRCMTQSHMDQGIGLGMDEEPNENIYVMSHSVPISDCKCKN